MGCFLCKFKINLVLTRLDSSLFENVLVRDLMRVRTCLVDCTEVVLLTSDVILVLHELLRDILPVA